MRQEVLTIMGANANQVIENFYQTFHPGAKFILANGNIQAYVVEKFYSRISVDVAATVLFELINQNLLVVHIAIAGGSDLLGVSLGAQKSFLKSIKNFLDKFSD